MVYDTAHPLGDGEAFCHVEEALKNPPFQPFSCRDTTNIPERVVIGLPVKPTGIVLPNTTLLASENWMASCVVMGHLVAALRYRIAFRTGDHTLLMRGSCVEIQHHNVHNSQVDLE